MRSCTFQDTRHNGWSSVREQLASVPSHWRLVVRTLGARDGSTHRISLRRRLTAGVALSVAAASVVIVGTSVPAFATSTGVAAVTPLSMAAGSLANYSIAFTATSGIAIGDTITITGPAGTKFPTLASHYLVNTTATTVAVTGGGTAAVTITSASTVTATTTATVAIAGVTNPTITGGKTLTIATTADAGATTSAGYTITTATAVTGVNVVTVSPAQVNATNALYSVTFTAATLLTANFDTITLTGPTGTVFPLVAADYTINAGGGTPITENLTPTQSAPNNVTLNVPPTTTGAGTPLAVNASNVTKPAIARTTETLTVSTSQDTTVATFSIASGG
jgi:hypothetical protein